MKKLIISLCLLLSVAIIYAGTLTLGSPMNKQSKGSKIAHSILKEISKRIAVEFKTVFYPRKRVVYILNQDDVTIDGVLMMYNGLDKENKKLIKISEVLFSSPVVAITKGKDIKINGWESLKGLTLAQPRGGNFITKHLSKIGLKAHSLDTAEQGLKYLLADRCDVFLVPPALIKQLLKKPEFKALKVLTPNVAVNDYYTYFLKKNSDIAKKYLNALTEMKKDGTYKKILESFK